MGDYLYLIIIGAVAIGVIAYAIVLSSKVNVDRSDISAEEVEDRRRAAKSARVKLAFFDSKNITFFEALKMALPKNYVVFPRVAVELLFYRLQRGELRLTGQYIDFCIFTEKYAPVLAIDLLDYSLAGESTVGMRANTKEIIRNSGVPVLDYDMRDVYNIDDLRRAIAKVMNPLIDIS